LSGDYIISLEVDSIVDKIFIIEDKFLDGSVPHFIVNPKSSGDRQMGIKKGFKELVSLLRPLGFLPSIEWIVGKYHVTITKRVTLSRRSVDRNIILLALTIITIFIDGYIRSSNPILTDWLMKGTPAFLNALLFTVGILLIFGVHELGHKLISDKQGILASLPYFIPSWPGLGGTFGAVIIQEEPPINRDDLWDLGFSGPLFGFIATIFIGIAGMILSFVIPIQEVSNWMVKYPEIRFQQIPMPLILVTLQNIFRQTPDGTALILHPVAFAAWVGCLVTFVNLMPAWQLDGGYVIRSLVGKETHKIVSACGILMMALSGFVFMAVIVAFFMIYGGEPIKPLDDVSPLSNSRKLGMLIYLTLMMVNLISLLPT